MRPSLCPVTVLASSSHFRPSQVIVKKCVWEHTWLGRTLKGVCEVGTGLLGATPCLCVCGSGSRAFTGNWPAQSCCFTPLTDRKSEINRNRTELKGSNRGWKQCENDFLLFIFYIVILRPKAQLNGICDASKRIEFGVGRWPGAWKYATQSVWKVEASWTFDKSASELHSY